MKNFFKVLGLLLLLVVVATAGLIAYLTVTEYRPSAREAAPMPSVSVDPQPFSGNTLTILTFNTGYAGLGDNADFFMDGGKEVRATDESRVRENMQEITSIIETTGADFTLLQEVDLDSARTYGIDQITEYFLETGLNASYALNYSCAYVPYPLPPIGRVNSGIETLTSFEMAEAERISLPCPFSWPVSAANLKRCLLLTRTPVAGTDKELVIVNLHLEAYDDGAGKLEQTQALLSVLEEEYEKGNYVIAGGDFNQTFPGSLEAYPIQNAEKWTPGVLEESALAEGWQFACDTSAPTCRLLDASYTAGETQCYVIDGFILSPNVSLTAVKTLDDQFRASDHNPVLLTAALQ